MKSLKSLSLKIPLMLAALLAAFVTFAPPSVVADSGDIWTAAPYITSTAETYPLRIDSGGVVCMTQLRRKHTVVTANATLTVTSPMVVGCSNNTAIVTLANATTAGNGYCQQVVNEAATGNITVSSASNISGGANDTVIQVTGATYISDGTHWFRI